MTLDELYAKMVAKAAKTTASGAPDASIRLNLTGGEPRSWLVRFREGRVSVGLSEDGDAPDLTVTATGDTLIKVATRRTNPVAAFMTGRIKISGDSSLVGQLKNIWPD
jgi:putative sterol carrier protein